jgi:hypothetical protein
MSKKKETPEVNEEAEETEEVKEGRTLIEELEVAGNELVGRIEELVREGNVRRLIIKHNDNVLLEVPLTIAAVAGTAVAIFNPVLAAIGALAALLTKVTVVVVREEDKEGKKKVEVKGEDEEE